MSLNNENIDFNLIEKYFSGKLSSIEKNALERKALDDPFLKDAMDGFQESPDGLERFKEIQSKNDKSSRFSFASRTISVLVVAICIYLISFYLYNPDKSEIVKNEIQENQESSLIEVEVISDAIDTFIIVKEEEQIKLSELVDNKLIIEEDNPLEPEHLEQEEFITIDEQNELDNHELEDENTEKGFTDYAPSIYIEGLYVVDYRKLKRKKKEVSYIKYEFSGLSAEFESEDSQSRTDLIEKEVKIPYMDYLKVSMEYFSKQKFKKALNRYTIILEQYPSDLNAFFYGGLCFYNMGKYQEAIDYFGSGLSIEKLADFHAFRQEIKWYTAKSLIKIGSIKKAQNVLDEIIMEGLFYSKEAIILRKKI